MENSSLQIKKCLSAVKLAHTGMSFLFVAGDRRLMLETALEFAKFIVCSANKEKREDDEPCGRCLDCQKVSKRQHPDVLWLEPEGLSSSIKIEEVRLVKKRISLKPYVAKKKVVVIQDSQQLSLEAANALLKILEEPPADSILILIAESTTQLLPTVVSRCQLIRFSAQETGQSRPDDFIDNLIVKFFAADEPNRSRELYEETAVLERSIVEKLLQELAFVFRDLVMIKVNSFGQTLLSHQKKEKLKIWAEFFAQEALEDILEEVLRIKDYIHKNANIKLCIDLLIKTITECLNARLTR